MDREKRRRILAEGYARAHPAIQAAMKENGGDVGAALLLMKELCPPVIDEIAERMNDSLAAGHKWAKTRNGMYGYVLKDGVFVLVDADIAAAGGSYPLMAAQTEEKLP